MARITFYMESGVYYSSTPNSSIPALLTGITRQKIKYGQIMVCKYYGSCL